MIKMTPPYIPPERKINVIEEDGALKEDGANLCLGVDVSFSTLALQSYAFKAWLPLMFDALVVAAAIEYGDRIVIRPSSGWARRISLNIPVHDPKHWNSSSVKQSLTECIEFLTGDYWDIKFIGRRRKAARPVSDGLLELSTPTEAILAYSDGLDSMAVAGIIGHALGQKLVRVRVGSKTYDRPSPRDVKQPFTSVPYRIKFTQKNKDTTARSRGFKFAMISGVAAYLTGAKKIIIPESGQGSIGPVLVPVAHAYPDYRNHPLFTMRMEQFFNALFDQEIKFEFPRIWHTKGETLRDYINLVPKSGWELTKSCWRGSQWTSVGGRQRQCGVCAACMLRRLSVHAANQVEPSDKYVCVDMSAPTLDKAVDKEFLFMNRAYEQYAVAGVLHMDHLADAASVKNIDHLKKHALFIGPALSMPIKKAEIQLADLLKRHAAEWNQYLSSLNKESFVRALAQAGE